MDKHIAEVAFVEDLKPAHAYNNFISNDKYSNKMDNIIQDILERNSPKTTPGIIIESTPLERIKELDLLFKQ